MCSRCLRSASFILLVILLASCSSRLEQNAPAQRVLRVCSDPNNLPFSNERGEGFENRIAELVARDLDARLEYTWFAQRRGFVRNTLRAGDCDLIMGVPVQFELVAATRPYYRSTYVFVTREDRALDIRTFDDPVLRRLDIGVHVIGDDYTNPPPMHALSRRNIVQNVAGYSIFGDYSEPNPPARLIEAVANGEVDLAIVWGPFAGFFAQQQSIPLRIVPVAPEIDLPALPFVFDIAMGIRRGEESFRGELERVLDRRQAEIDRILAEFGVPVKPMPREMAAVVRQR
jgi:quinoprotein dehydrogenase-associated probable ABC transporter substrate-binding protein